MTAVGPHGYRARYGYYTDQETGLVALAYRYYEPGMGRFLNRDPVGFDGGVNLYGYVGAEPIGTVDPAGTRTDYECYQRLLDKYERCLVICDLAAWAAGLVCAVVCADSPVPAAICIAACIAAGRAVHQRCERDCREELAQHVAECERCN